MGLSKYFKEAVQSSYKTVFNRATNKLQASNQGRITVFSEEFSWSLLVLAAIVIKSDGKILQTELNFMHEYLCKQYGKEKGLAKLNLFNDILLESLEADEVCAYVLLNMDYPARLQLFEFLFALAQADHFVHENEKATLFAMADKMGIYQIDIESVKNPYQASNNSPYKVLDLEPSCSNEEIRAAFRKVARKSHPDKIVQNGFYSENTGDDFRQAVEA